MFETQQDAILLCESFLLCMSVGEACWWTIHPASKQRSEGEKVRVGDDLILVSISSERYLVSSRGAPNFLLLCKMHNGCKHYLEPAAACAVPSPLGLMVRTWPPCWISQYMSQTHMFFNFRFSFLMCPFCFILQHLSYGNGSLHVDAAFQQTLWSVAPICSGSEVAQGKPFSVLVCMVLFLLLPSCFCIFFISSI